MPSSAPQPPVGIDLGTTYSVVAYLDKTGRPVSVPNSSGDLITPSAVVFEDEGPVVGREAVKSSVLEPARVPAVRQSASVEIQPDAARDLEDLDRWRRKLCSHWVPR